MNMEEQSRLSFYRQLDNIHGKENIRLVKHTETGQLYVLKILDVYDKDIYDMLKASPHPYVPCVYECIEDDGRLYVVEEYIHGITLETYMAERGTLGEAEACRIIEALCGILAHFHAMTPQVIHRDIKPSNVMLQGDFKKHDGRYSVYLIDFNTARRYDVHASRDTEAIGTRGFAAPEQYGFAQSDARTDIYALGALLNYMLTGSLEMHAGYTGDRRIVQVISAAMSMDPTGRFQSVMEMAAALCEDESAAGYSKSCLPLDGIADERCKYGSLGFRRFIPPGFRSGNPLYIVAASAYYLLICYMCLTIVFTDPETHEPLGSVLQAVNRICIFLAFIGLPCICGNYLGIWSKLPLMRSRRRPIRIIGAVICSTLWLFLMAFVCAALEIIFK